VRGGEGKVRGGEGEWIGPHPLTKILDPPLLVLSEDPPRRDNMKDNQHSSETNIIMTRLTIWLLQTGYGHCLYQYTTGIEG